MSGVKKIMATEKGLVESKCRLKCQNELISVTKNNYRYFPKHVAFLGEHVVVGEYGVVFGHGLTLVSDVKV